MTSAVSHLASRIPLFPVSLLILALSLAPVDALAAGKRDPATFFGTIEDMEIAKLDELRASLLAIGEECDRVGKFCPPAEEFLQQITGSLDLRRIPLYVVYIDEEMVVRTNRLLWKNRVTPFVRGTQNLSVLVFTEKPLPLEPRLVVLYDQPGSFIQGFRDVFVSEGKRTMDARDASGVVEKLPYRNLGEDGGDTLWVGTTRFHLEPMNAYRLSLLPTGDTADLAPDFRAIQGQFSNSSDKTAAFGFALGATFNTEPGDQEVLDGVQVGDANLDVYLMVTVNIRKPVLVRPIAQRKGGRYRPSYGITFGTNVRFWDTEEFIIAFNYGYLFGRNGIVIGANFIDPFAPQVDNSRVLPYFGIEFKF